MLGSLFDKVAHVLSYDLCGIFKNTYFLRSSLFYNTSTNTSQHESTQINTSLTRVNTSPTRVNTSQYESNTSQHESKTGPR